jgi:hypothetical protein
MRTDLTLGAAVVALAMFVGAGHLRAAPTKESWEYSGTMDADGMKVPLPATTVCVAADATTPPVDKNCKLSDVKTVGDKTSFQIACGKPNPMSGTGESTRSRDKVQSTYRLKSADGDVVTRLTGHRVGSCAQ